MQPVFERPLATLACVSGDGSGCFRGRPRGRFGGGATGVSVPASDVSPGVKVPGDPRAAGVPSSEESSSSSSSIFVSTSPAGPSDMMAKCKPAMDVARKEQAEDDVEAVDRSERHELESRDKRGRPVEERELRLLRCARESVKGSFWSWSSWTRSGGWCGWCRLRLWW